MTLLFTDLVGSTELLDRLGDDANERLRRAHFRLLREAVADCGGEEVKNLGDGLMVIFDSAVDGVECGIAMQRATARYNYGRGEDSIAVRVGLHVGEPIRDEGDYFGRAVVIAKRLCDRAGGGQIIASDLVRGLASGRNFSFDELGPLALKGISEPVPAFTVDWDPAATAGREAPPDPRGLRLVGRGRELELLEADISKALLEGLRSVLIVGEPGVGKTRLISELLQGHRDDVVALTARAYPLGTTSSLGLWVEALEGHLRSLEPAEVVELCGAYVDDLAALLPTVAASSGSAATDPPRVRQLEGLASLLANLSRRMPLTIVLDDVHLADGSSWEAVNYLARNLSTSPILLVLVARVLELADEHMASEVVLALEQESLLRKQYVGALERSEMAEFAAAFLEREPPARLVEWLAERSQGSPLFAAGLLRALVDERADLENPTLQSLPEDLSERVAARLNHLDPTDRSTLEIIAVVGARVELTDLVALAGRPLEDVADTLETLVRQRYVSEEERGRELWYEIAHPLIQEAIYASLSGARRRALHRFVARTLVNTGRLGAAAGHFVFSATTGDSEAITALQEALRQAEARGHHREALMLLQALLEIVPPGDARWLDVFDAMSPQAEWVVDHRADTNWETGLAAMRRIEQLVDRSGNKERLATAKFNVGSFLVWGAGDTEAGMAIVQEAHDLYEQDGNRRGAALAMSELGYYTAILGDATGHVEIATEVIERGQRDGDRLVELQGYCSLAHANLWNGHITDADAAILAGLDLAREDGRLYRTSYLLSQRALAVAFQGRIDEAQHLLAAGREANPDYRDTLLTEYALNIALLSGDFAAAQGFGRELLAWDDGRISLRRAYGTSFAGLCAIERDDITEAAHISGMCAELMAGRDWWIHSGVTRWLHAAVRAARGDATGALNEYESTIAYFAKIGCSLYASFMLADLADLVVATAEIDPYDRSRVLIKAAGVPPSTAPIEALLTYAEGAAALVSANTATAVDALRRAAEVFADAGWRPYEARARVLLGRALGPSDREAAVDQMTQAIDIFEHSGAERRRIAALGVLDSLGTRGRRTRTAVAGPVSLTKREREVAHLAADGLSAKQIAGRLFIGERTVETHLANTYAKLGVANRTELARRAAEFDL